MGIISSLCKCCCKDLKMAQARETRIHEPRERDGMNDDTPSPVPRLWDRKREGNGREGPQCVQQRSAMKTKPRVWRAGCLRVRVEPWTYYYNNDRVALPSSNRLAGLPGEIWLVVCSFGLSSLTGYGR